MGSDALPASHAKKTVAPVTRIAVDCMGGDFGIPVTIPASLEFAQLNSNVHLLLVGLQTPIEQALIAASGLFPTVGPDRYTIIPATEVVTMSDSVEVALRRKKGSSMRVAAQAVKDGLADACISAGNTGAWMAISRYVIKTMPGIDRPAIAAPLPNQKGGVTTMLDLGANVDCTAEHLLQFAIMGSALAQVQDMSKRPTIGLLNIGEEAIKGNDIVKKAGELMRNSPLNFFGNVEGNDIFKGTVDVVVCDGFVGNALLKAVEGMSTMLGVMIKEEFTRSIFTMVSGLLVKSVLNRLRSRVDNRRYNGAALLGLQGVVIKSHGSADAFAFRHALQRAYEAAQSGLIERIAAAIADMASPSLSTLTETSAQEVI